MLQAVKQNDMVELKKSFYLLTRQLTEIESAFNVQFHTKYNRELTEHQEFIITTCKSLDRMKVPVIR